MKLQCKLIEWDADCKWSDWLPVGEEFKHGIYRDIPLRSKKSGTDIYKSHVKMNSVKRNGEPENYTSDTSYEGVSYRVGSADRYVDSGINKYEFNYTIYNAVFEKDGIYQVYFNPIGQFWNVPIESADVSISFENNEPVGENEVQQLEVYTGEYGETGKKLYYSSGERYYKNKD